MLSHKNQWAKGKFSLVKFFQKFEPGDRVAVIRELSFPFNYKKGLQGRSGKVLSKRGSAYYIEINDLNKPKRYLIKPIHLKKIR
jgi:large subunit ribosomal protein L21e